MQSGQAFLPVQVDFCMSQDVSSNGTAGVVDGWRVLLTPLQRALVPPPMCAVAAVFHQPVQCIAFGDHDGNEVCWQTHMTHSCSLPTLSQASEISKSLSKAVLHGWLHTVTALYAVLHPVEKTSFLAAAAAVQTPALSHSCSHTCGGQ